jgi:hypothetical protein
LARKNILLHEVVASQSMATSFKTPPTVIKYLDNCTYQINISTSNSVGTFNVEASNDYAVNEPGTQVTNPGNWIPLTLAGGTPFANGTNDNIIISMAGLPFSAIRLSYTSSTAGTGRCDVYIVAKQIGG